MNRSMHYLKILSFTAVILCGIESASGHNRPDSLFEAGDTVITLNEVLVKSAKITHHGLNYKINDVPNSILAETGDLFDMLKRTPGILVSPNQDISVMGGGQPIIYIDGRRIISTTELTGQLSSNIKSIEVIRQPGVEYPDGTTSVIKLTTIKHLKDFAGITVRNKIDFKRYVSDNSSATLNLALGKVSFLSSMSYRYGHSKSYTYTELKTPESSFGNTFMEDTKYILENKAHTFSPIIQLGYNPTATNSFILSYSGKIVHRSPDGMLYDNSGTEDIKETQRSLRNHQESHTVTAGYTFNSDRKNFSTFLSFQHQGINNNRELTAVPSALSSDYNEISSLNLATGTVEYSQSIGSIYLTTGGEYGYIRSKTNRIRDTYERIFVQTDNNYALYSSLSARIANVSLNGGIRFSGIKTDFPAIDIKESHFSVYPNLRSRWFINSVHTIGFSASRSQYWPTVAQLNPAYNYIDSYRSTCGNPNLRPITWSKLSVDANVRDFTISLSFTNRKKCIIDFNELIDNKSILTYPVNARWKNDFDLEADYEFDLGKVSGSVYADLYYTATKVSPATNLIRDFYASTSFDINWTVLKNVDIYGSFYYQSPLKLGYKRIDSQIDLSGGISCKFLKKALSVILDVSDLFNRSILPNRYKYRSPILTETVRHSYDGRGCTISIIYRLDSTKTRFIFAKDNGETTGRAILQ